MKKPELYRTIEKVIRTYRLFDPGAKILIGVSGGPDSMALLSLLAELRPVWNLTLTACYCHHGLRPAANEEASFVADWAGRLGCAFVSQRLSLPLFLKKGGWSVQEAARVLRYQAFLDQMQNRQADRVALGHTADDLGEEVLIGLIRGAGLGGLAGIPIRRQAFVRPLLKTTREEILQYLREKNIPFKEDASNRDGRYLRARIRHHLLPELTRYSPNIMAQLNRTAWILREDEAFLQQCVHQEEKKVALYRGPSVRFLRNKLAALPQAISSRLIQKALLEIRGDLRKISSVHLLSILRAAGSSSRKGRLPLPSGWEAWWNDKEIGLRPVSSIPPRIGSFLYRLDGPGKVLIKESNTLLIFKKVTILPGNSFIDRNPSRARVDLQKISWPLLIRNLEPGDRFQPLGLKGSKKVHRFLMDRKVPEALRSGIPLVLSEGRVVWVAGMALSQPFALDHGSRSALEMECRITHPNLMAQS
jgi:tRNA(Ile)-lysidine synthase